MSGGIMPAGGAGVPNNMDIPTFEGYEIYFPHNLDTKIAIYLNQIGHQKKYIFSNSWDSEVKGNYYCVEHPDDSDSSKLAEFPWNKIRVINAAKDKCTFILERNSSFPVQFKLKTEDGTSIQYGPELLNIDEELDITQKYPPFSYVSIADDEGGEDNKYHKIICNSSIQNGGRRSAKKHRKTRAKKYRKIRRTRKY